MSEMMTDCKWCGKRNIPVKEMSTEIGYEYYGLCPQCGRKTIVEEVNLIDNSSKEYETARDIKETRCYYIRGSQKNLDTIEKFLRHAEYLGSIGASRNLLLRVDGDGFGQIQIFNSQMQKIDRNKYNTKQDLGPGALSGIYDIG